MKLTRAPQLLFVGLVWLCSLSVTFAQAANSVNQHATVSTAEQKIYAPELQQLALAYAKEFLSQVNTGSRVEYRAAKIDARMAMTRCSLPLRFNGPKSNARAGRKIVKVSCEDKKSWSVFIPLSFTYWQKVVTAKHSISRNTVISADDVVLTEHALVSQVADYHSEIAQIVGQSAKRSIAEGQAIRQQALKPSRWIKRGDQVTIVSTTPNLEIKMAGIAMSDGSQGQQISVRNKSSKRIIKAMVVAPGKVKPLM
tara:strand:- start:1834 stop:2595 length:762 start_codon:yes stop_codon:yes gene_type:complete